MSASLPPDHARLVLVRHGEASGNRELRYLGSTDAPLTERGQAQAEQVARALAAFAPSAVYTSPLARARDTARAIAAAAGLAEAEAEPDLRECDYGAWEGLTRQEAQARDPELVRRWDGDPDLAPPGGGESLRQLQGRVVACADTLAARSPGATLVLVSHVGPVKALVCHALGLGLEGMRRMWLDPASITVLDWPVSAGPGRVRLLRLYNAASHLIEGVRWLAPSP